MVNLQTPLERIVKAKSVVSKFAHLGVLTLGDLLWYPPRRTYRWGELTRFDSLIPGADVTVFAVVMDSRLGWTRRHDKAMLTVTLQDQLETDALDQGGFRPDLWGKRANRLTVRFFAKHPNALNMHANRLEKGTLAVFAGRLSGKPGSRASEAFLAHPEYRVLADYDPEVVKTLSTRPQPLYHATAGLPSWKIGKIIDTQLLMLNPAEIPEAIPDSLRRERNLPDAYAALLGLHHPETDAQYQAAVDYLRFREAFTLGAALAKARNQVQAHPAWSLPVSRDASAPSTGERGEPGDLVSQVVAGLPFQLTAGQCQVWDEIAEDIAREVPMNRLLQGEVGSGKTVVSALACVAAVQNGFQAAFMAPTEVLAHQHFQTLNRLLGALADPLGELSGAQPGTDSVPLRLLTGSTPAPEKRKIADRGATGEPMLVVGTQALLTESLQLSRLALVVVDEQHRFGVEQRGALLAKGERAPHFLTMTATPIPRTVAMTVFGDLDVSVLRQLPAGRAEVQTFLVNEANVRWVTRAWSRAAEEIERGGRVYVLCPKIAPDAPELDSADSADTQNPPETGRKKRKTPAQTSWGDDLAGFGELEELEPGRVLHTVTQTAAQLAELPVFRDIPIGVAHSNLDSGAKQQAVADFAAGRTPLLVSTTVVEVGMDVPEASMMIILDADRYGISQLHQLRGRIGRGSRPGVCLAIAPLDFPPVSDNLADLMAQAGEGTLAPALARLLAFAASRDGFALAEADLRIRREGDVLGQSQSGRRSRLKVLSLVSDAEVIAAAKTAAAAVVAEDPQLSVHPELARLVFDLGEGAQNLTKS